MKQVTEAERLSWMSDIFKRMRWSSVRPDPFKDFQSLKSKENDISDKERIIINDILARPYISETERYKSLYFKSKPLSLAAGSRLTEGLVKKDFIKKHKVHLNPRGGHSVFLEITPKGISAHGITISHCSKGGGIVHDVWIVKLKEHFSQLRSDMEILIEQEVQYIEKSQDMEEVHKKSVDLVIKLSTGEKIGIEVEITSPIVHIQEQILKDVKVQLDFLIVAVVDQATASVVRKFIAEQQLIAKVGVCLLNRLLSCEKMTSVLPYSAFLVERGL